MSDKTSDTISRQAAIDATWFEPSYTDPLNVLTEVRDRLKVVPPAESEPAIPLSWIEGQIRWLRSLDNAFSDLTAGQISAMVNKWKDEQNE